MSVDDGSEDPTDALRQLVRENPDDARALADSAGPRIRARLMELLDEANTEGQP